MTIDEYIGSLEGSETNTRFDRLVRICQENFGNERIKGSHYIFKTKWPGDPRINLQRVKGFAKPYQVRQVIQALRKLQEVEEAKKQQESEQSQKKGETRYATEQKRK